MKTSGFLRASLFGSLLLSTGLVQAQVTAAQAARLGQELTPIGAEKAGNAAGTIPAWDGGLARDANAYDPALGDPQWQIAPGTPFADLPPHWRCPNCDCDAEQFLLLPD